MQVPGRAAGKAASTELCSQVIQCVVCLLLGEWRAAGEQAGQGEEGAHGTDGLADVLLTGLCGRG